MPSMPIAHCRRCSTDYSLEDLDSCPNCVPPPAEPEAEKPKPPNPMDERWVCKTCGKPGCAKPGNPICSCNVPKWEIFNWATGETYSVPEWWSRHYPENS